VAEQEETAGRKMAIRQENHTNKTAGWTKHLVPKEHGAWAMWILPFIIGVAAAGTFGINASLIFLGSLFAFGARAAVASAIRLSRRDTAIAKKCALFGLLELLSALACIAPLVFAGNITLAMIVFTASLLLLTDFWWIRDRMEKNLIAELLGVAGFALTAPAVYVAQLGIWHPEALILWFISFGYFAGSVFYVKLRIARLITVKSNKNQNDKIYSKLIYIYVVSITAATLLMTSITDISSWLLMAFIPWMIYLVRQGAQPVKNIDRVGWTLVAHSIYFTAFVAILFMMR
jgi:hypothetical protein